MGLARLPDTFASTREALHLVAERIVAAARKPDNEIALTVTAAGFGTPPFEFSGATHQVRVEGIELVHEHGGEVERAPIDSLAGAAQLLGPELLPDGLPEDSDPLALDPFAADCLADFFAFAGDVLAAFREGLADDEAPSEAILWPEHFDVAVATGAEGSEAGATYGASPGDERHSEPYLYVLPAAERQGELWNAQGFAGAELAYSELVAAADPDAVAGEFFESRRSALQG